MNVYLFHTWSTQFRGIFIKFLKQSYWFKHQLPAMMVTLIMHLFYSTNSLFLFLASLLSGLLNAYFHLSLWIGVNPAEQTGQYRFTECTNTWILIILHFPSSVHLPSFLSLLNLKKLICSILLSLSSLPAHEITLSIRIHTKAVTHLHSDFLSLTWCPLRNPRSVCVCMCTSTNSEYSYTCNSHCFSLACTISTSNSIGLNKKSSPSFWNLPFFLCFLLRNGSTIYSNPGVEMSNLSWFWSIINHIQLLMKPYLFSYFNIM